MERAYEGDDIQTAGSPSLLAGASEGGVGILEAESLKTWISNWRFTDMPATAVAGKAQTRALPEV